MERIEHLAITAGTMAPTLVLSINFTQLETDLSLSQNIVRLVIAMQLFVGMNYLGTYQSCALTQQVARP